MAALGRLRSISLLNANGSDGWIAEIRTGFLRELSDCSCIIGTAANSPKYALISANFVTIQAGAPMVGQGGEGRRSCVPRICPFQYGKPGTGPPTSGKSGLVPMRMLILSSDDVVFTYCSCLFGKMSGWGLVRASCGRGQGR